MWRCSLKLLWESFYGVCKSSHYTVTLSSYTVCSRWVSQLCLVLCNPMDCRLPGSSAHGILWVIKLEWVPISSFRGSPRPRDWMWVSALAVRFLTTEPAEKPQTYAVPHVNCSATKLRRGEDRRSRVLFNLWGTSAVSSALPLDQWSWVVYILNPDTHFKFSEIQRPCPCFEWLNIC